jgi:hypothetical protein
MRSSVVPQTIASDTAQNTNWKKNFASIEALESPMTGKPVDGSPKPLARKPVPPIRPVSASGSLPNANAKPTRYHMTAAIEKFVTIFATTVPAFFCLEKPISKNMKPACMNITRQPATTTHIVFRPTESGRTPFS